MIHSGSVNIWQTVFDAANIGNKMISQKMLNDIISSFPHKIDFFQICISDWIWYDENEPILHNFDNLKAIARKNR